MTNAEATQAANDLIAESRNNPELRRMIIALVCSEEEIAQLQTAEKNARISAMLLAHVNAGKSMRQAWDLVFGEGAYEEFAGNLYDELRSRGAAKGATVSAEA